MKQLTKLLKKIAQIYSAITTPFFMVVFPLIFIKPYDKWWLLILINNTLLRFLWYMFLYKTKRISDLDVSNPKERPLSALGDLGVFFLSLLLAIESHNISLITYTLALVFIAFVFQRVSTLTKISGHATYITFAMLYLFLNRPKPFTAFLAIIIILITGFARLQLKKHSPFQLFLGITLTILEFGFIYLGLNFLK